MTVNLGLFTIAGVFLLTRPSRDVTLKHPAKTRRIAISTHTPLAGRDAMTTSTAVEHMSFLLTRPSRDVTDGTIHGGDGQLDFYSHAPRGT